MSRGLGAVETSRAERNRVKRPPFKVILWFTMTIAVGLILYFRWESTQTESARQKLLSKQREAIALFGQQWFDVRDGIEKWTVEAAGRPEPDLVETAELEQFDFRQMPGIYLRLRKDQAKDVASVREAAMGSLRDGFTSCLMHNKSDSPIVGKECKDSSECELGQMCNEYARCAKPGQPYNLRLAYKSFGVLSPQFEKEARETTNSLTIRGLDAQFEAAKQSDFPIAIDLLSKAKFFLVVVDERPAPASPPATDAADAGPPPEDVEAAAGMTYPSRVALYRIEDGKLLLRLTREAKAELLGGAPIGDTEVAAAFKRQAQSCALANEVKNVLP